MTCGAVESLTLHDHHSFVQGWRKPGGWPDDVQFVALTAEGSEALRTDLRIADDLTYLDQIGEPMPQDSAGEFGFIHLDAAQVGRLRSHGSWLRAELVAGETLLHQMSLTILDH